MLHQLGNGDTARPEIGQRERLGLVENDAAAGQIVELLAAGRPEAVSLPAAKRCNPAPAVWNGLPEWEHLLCLSNIAGIWAFHLAKETVKSEDDCS